MLSGYALRQKIQDVRWVRVTFGALLLGQHVGLKGGGHCEPRGAESRRVGRAMSCTRSTSAGMSAAISAPAPAAGEEGSRSEEKCLFVSEIVTKQ